MIHYKPHVLDRLLYIRHVDPYRPGTLADILVKRRKPSAVLIMLNFDIRN